MSKSQNKISASYKGDSKSTKPKGRSKSGAVPIVTEPIIIPDENMQNNVDKKKVNAVKKNT